MYVPNCSTFWTTAFRLELLYSAEFWVGIGQAPSDVLTGDWQRYPLKHSNFYFLFFTLFETKRKLYPSPKLYIQLFLYLSIHAHSWGWLGVWHILDQGDIFQKQRQRHTDGVFCLVGSQNVVMHQRPTVGVIKIIFFSQTIETNKIAIIIVGMEKDQQGAGRLEELWKGIN